MKSYILLALSWQGFLDWLEKAVVDVFWGVYKEFSWVGQHVMSWIVDAAAASGAFPMVNWTSVRTHLDAINFFFPLNETITIVLGLFTLWLTMWTYRMVKSWIPTESS